MLRLTILQAPPLKIPANRRPLKATSNQQRTPQLPTNRLYHKLRQLIQLHPRNNRLLQPRLPTLPQLMPIRPPQPITLIRKRHQITQRQVMLQMNLRNRINPPPARIQTRLQRTQQPTRRAPTRPKRRRQTHQTTSNGITNPNKSADKTAATKDQAAQLNALVKQYLATYNRLHNTTYQLSDTTILANTIENNLTDTQSQVADQQTIYNNLNTLLDKMIADNRLYLLQNFHGVDIAFNLVTNGTIYTNVAKSLVIPIYIQTTDSNGNQIGELIPVTDANGNSLQYGDSWSTLAPTLADYQLTSNAAAASSGSWNAGFDYGQLNAKGELIIKYVYTKIPVTPIIPITPIAPVEPDVPQPTPTQPPVLTQQITSQPTTLSPNIVFENPTPVSEPVTITRPAFKPNHNDYTNLPNRQPKQPPDTREAIALRDLVQTNPFTLVAQYTIPVVRTASRVANPVASQETAKAQPESQVASVPYIQPRLDATEQPLIVRNAALDLAASTVQAQNKLTNPIIKPHQPAREFPGGLPGHTQLGVFFSILSGKVNFGTTTDEENKL